MFYYLYYLYQKYMFISKIFDQNKYRGGKGVVADN